MSNVMARIKSSWTESQALLNERMANGTQPDLPFVNVQFLVYAVSFYVVITMVLYNFMQKRDKPFNVRPFMLVYNCSCVFAAGYVLVGIVADRLSNPTKAWVCLSTTTSPACNSMGHYFWFFYIQKFWEFIDTWLFLLRRSFRQVTFLHLFHHASICIVVGVILPHDWCGDMFLPIALNAFVHVLMYAHYLVTGLGLKSWWRPYLTSLQLIQFCLISAQSLYSLYAGPSCGSPDWTAFLMVCYMASMLVLFGNFFIRRYLVKASKPMPPPCVGVLKANTEHLKKTN